MALFTSKQNVLSIFGDIKSSIWAIIIESEVENVLSSLLWEDAFKFLLIDFQSSFSFMLHLKISSIFSIEDLILFFESELDFFLDDSWLF